MNQSITVEIRKSQQGALSFSNNENNRKTLKNGFIYKFKGFFIFPRSDVIDVRADMSEGRAVSGKR